MIRVYTAEMVPPVGILMAQLKNPLVPKTPQYHCAVLFEGESPNTPQYHSAVLFEGFQGGLVLGHH